jgi:hypothetical protein
MMEAVHHYEGTVNQVMDDGIMGLFRCAAGRKSGVPIDVIACGRREANPLTNAQIALVETTIRNAREAFLNYHRERPSSGGLLAGKSAFASAR